MAGVAQLRCLTFPITDHLSLQGYEGSLIKLTSRQVISLQDFSLSQPRPAAELGPKPVLLSSVLKHLAADTYPLSSWSSPALMKK